MTERSDIPTKAYYVQRISRSVTTVRVYAFDPADAKRRYLDGEYTCASTEHEGRGFGRVWREPDEDRSGPVFGGPRPQEKR